MTTDIRNTALALMGVLAMTMARVAAADAPAQTPIARQSLDDAWWTGPLLAASPGTLAQGHWLVEPYVYDAIVDARFDSSGKRRTVARRAISVRKATYCTDWSIR